MVLDSVLQLHFKSPNLKYYKDAYTLCGNFPKCLNSNTQSMQKNAVPLREQLS